MCSCSGNSFRSMRVKPRMEDAAVFPSLQAITFPNPMDVAYKSWCNRNKQFVVKELKQGEPQT